MIEGCSPVMASSTSHHFDSLGLHRDDSSDNSQKHRISVGVAQPLAARALQKTDKSFTESGSPGVARVL